MNAFKTFGPFPLERDGSKLSASALNDFGTAGEKTLPGSQMLCMRCELGRRQGLRRIGRLW